MDPTTLALFFILLVVMPFTQYLAYAEGRRIGSREGAERGWRDAKAYEESRMADYWPKDPPAEIRYSERPHLENDCGTVCARYVLVNGPN
jgi:hypothetical protein